MNSTEKRKNQRTAHLKPTQIMLKNHSYQIKDISNNGVGIILDKDNVPIITDGYDNYVKDDSGI